MRIPTVTDEMLHKVLEQAQPPVLVVFNQGGPRMRVLRRELGLIADDFDDRVIFLAVDVDENPTLCTFGEYPFIVVFKQKEVARSWSDADNHRVLIEATL